MNQGKYVFSQLMGLISHKKFNTLVTRHKGDYKVKDFSCWKQYLCMAFGQLTHRESLSDTILCLKANADKMYHLGIVKWLQKVLFPLQTKIVLTSWMSNWRWNL